MEQQQYHAMLQVRLMHESSVLVAAENVLISGGSLCLSLEMLEQETHAHIFNRVRHFTFIYVGRVFQQRPRIG